MHLPPPGYTGAGVTLEIEIESDNRQFRQSGSNSNSRKGSAICIRSLFVPDFLKSLCGVAAACDGEANMKSCGRAVFVFIAAAAALVSAGASSARDRGGAGAGKVTGPAAEFRRASRTVEHEANASQGFAIEDSEAAKTALAAQWSAVRRLVLMLLDRKPGMAEAALGKAARMAAGLEIAAARFGPDTFWISATTGVFGTGFLVQRGADRHHRVVLSLDEPSGTGDAWPALRAWWPEAAQASCLARAAASSERCGPIRVHAFLPLARERNGTPRFAVIGHYSTPMGATDGYQISIWRWDGRSATPLSSRLFSQVAGQPVVVAQDAGGFSLHVKADYQNFLACGSCRGRQMTWRFNLPSTGSAAPIEHSLTPEVDVVDRLYGRMAAGERAADLAAGPVIRTLRPMIDPEGYGLLDSWTVRPAGRGTRLLCIMADAFSRPQLFTIVRRNGRDWISAVRFGFGQTCTGGQS